MSLFVVFQQMCFCLRDHQFEDFARTDQDRRISSLVSMDHQQQILHSRCQAMCCPKHFSNVSRDRPVHAGFHRVFWQYSGTWFKNELLFENLNFRWYMCNVCHVRVVFAEGWYWKATTVDISGGRSCSRGAHSGVWQSLWKWLVFQLCMKVWKHEESVYNFAGYCKASEIEFVF